MNDETPADECCIVCRKPTAGNTGTAHLYHGGRRFTLCCPLCVEVFGRAPARFAAGDHPQSLLEQMIDEMKWKGPGS